MLIYQEEGVREPQEIPKAERGTQEDVEGEGKTSFKYAKLSICEAKYMPDFNRLLT